MIKAEDLKPGDKVIYFEKNYIWGKLFNVGYNFNMEIDKVLKTKVKTKNGRDFKIENGKIYCFYPQE